MTVYIFQIQYNSIFLGQIKFDAIFAIVIFNKNFVTSSKELDLDQIFFFTLFRIYSPFCGPQYRICFSSAITWESTTSPQGRSVWSQLLLSRWSHGFKVGMARDVTELSRMSF